jgi:hypothetical protein
LDLIDERFLKNPDTEYTYIYSTIMALRFHGEEPTSKLPRERLLASMRLLLDNPEFADQVIPDLARWEDWSVLDRLVAMFKASDKNGYVRQPVVTYLTVASEQTGELGTRAQKSLEELEQLDPEGVRQARSLMAFGALGRARASATTVADGSTTPNESEDASTSPEVTEGLAATPAEIQEAEAAKPADFLDPENFSQSQAPEDESTESEVTNSGPGGPKTDTSQPEESDEVSQKAATPVAAAAATGSSPPNVVTAPVQESELNTYLAVGVPLAAAALLVGIYWVILRAGAV